MKNTFVKLLTDGDNKFTAMVITPTPKPSKKPLTASVAQSWTPTVYAKGKIHAEWPKALSNKIDTFMVPLSVTGGDAVTDWSKFTFTITGKDSTGKDLPAESLTGAATTMGVTIQMSPNFINSLKAEVKFTDIVITAAKGPGSPLPASPSSDSSWAPTVYTEQLQYGFTPTKDHLSVLDGKADNVGTVTLMSTTDKKATDVQPMPSVWLHLMSKDSPNVYATVMATVDQLTGDTTISDYSPATIAFIDDLVSSQIAVGQDDSAKASDAEDILLCSGEFLAPYIVVTTKDKKNGVLHVAYKGNTCGEDKPAVQAVVAGKQPAVDVTGGELNVAVNFDDKQPTGHYKPSDKKGPTIQLMTKLAGRIQPSVSGTVDVYYVNEAAMSVMVSNKKLLYIANVTDSITVKAMFSNDTTLYPNAKTEGLILTVSTDGQSDDTDPQIEANTNSIVDILPLLKEGKSNQKITSTVTAWTMLENQLINLGTYSTSFITQVLDVGSASGVSSDFKVVKSKSCGIQIDLTFIPTKPVLNGSCFVDGMNTTIHKFTEGKNDTHGRTPLTLKYLQPAMEGKDINGIKCDFSLNGAQYYVMAKIFDDASFDPYEENPMVAALKNTNFSAVIKDKVQTGPVEGCFGSQYSPLVEVTCKNDLSVSMYGDGGTTKWKYTTMNETDKTYDAGTTNLTAIISDTCGSASILPAALMITLVSVFNIFK